MNKYDDISFNLEQEFANNSDSVKSGNIKSCAQRISRCLVGKTYNNFLVLNE